MESKEGAKEVVGEKGGKEEEKEEQKGEVKRKEEVGEVGEKEGKEEENKEETNTPTLPTPPTPPPNLPPKYWNNKQVCEWLSHIGLKRNFLNWEEMVDVFDEKEWSVFDIKILIKVISREEFEVVVEGGLGGGEKEEEEFEEEMFEEEGVDEEELEWDSYDENRELNIYSPPQRPSSPPLSPSLPHPPLPSSYLPTFPPSLNHPPPPPPSNLSHPLRPIASYPDSSSPISFAPSLSPSNYLSSNSPPPPSSFIHPPPAPSSSTYLPSSPINPSTYLPSPLDSSSSTSTYLPSSPINPSTYLPSSLDQPTSSPHFSPSTPSSPINPSTYLPSSHDSPPPPPTDSLHSLPTYLPSSFNRDTSSSPPPLSPSTYLPSSLNLQASSPIDSSTYLPSPLDQPPSSPHSSPRDSTNFPSSLNRQPSPSMDSSTYLRSSLDSSPNSSLTPSGTYLPSSLDSSFDSSLDSSTNSSLSVSTYLASSLDYPDTPSSSISSQSSSDSPSFLTSLFLCSSEYSPSWFSLFSRQRSSLSIQQKKREETKEENTEEKKENTTKESDTEKKEAKKEERKEDKTNGRGGIREEISCFGPYAWESADYMYKYNGTLGQGHFGVTYEVIRKKESQKGEEGKASRRFALKNLFVPETDDFQAQNLFLNQKLKEVNAYAQVPRSPYLLHLEDVFLHLPHPTHPSERCRSRISLCLVTRLIGHLTCQSILKLPQNTLSSSPSLFSSSSSPRLPWKICHRWLTQLGKGLTSLHNHGLVHDDIKPDNVLIEGVEVNEKTGEVDFRNSNVVLCDFGLLCHEGTVGNAVCLQWAAPERVELVPDRRVSTSSCDIYSTALVFLSLLTGIPCFVSCLPSSRSSLANALPAIKEERDQIIKKALASLSSNNPPFRPPPTFITLLTESLSSSPSKRPLASSLHTIDINSDWNSMKNLKARGVETLLCGCSQEHAYSLWERLILSTEERGKEDVVGNREGDSSSVSLNHFLCVFGKHIQQQNRMVTPASLFLLSFLLLGGETSSSYIHENTINEFDSFTLIEGNKGETYIYSLLGGIWCATKEYSRLIAGVGKEGMEEIGKKSGEITGRVMCQSFVSLWSWVSEGGDVLHQLDNLFYFFTRNNALRWQCYYGGPKKEGSSSLPYWTFSLGYLGAQRHTLLFSYLQPKTMKVYNGKALEESRRNNYESTTKEGTCMYLKVDEGGEIVNYPAGFPALVEDMLALHEKSSFPRNFEPRRYQRAF